MVAETSIRRRANSMCAVYTSLTETISERLNSTGLIISFSIHLDWAASVDYCAIHFAFGMHFAAEISLLT